MESLYTSAWFVTGYPEWRVKRGEAREFDHHLQHEHLRHTVPFEL